MPQATRTTYVATLAALLALLALTVGVSFVKHGPWSVVAAVTIAMAKAVLIVLFFMHVRYEVSLVRVFSVAGFLWLTILIVFLMSDYVTRTGVTPGPPPEEERHPADRSAATVRGQQSESGHGAGALDESPVPVRGGGFEARSGTIVALEKPYHSLLFHARSRHGFFPARAGSVATDGRPCSGQTAARRKRTVARRPRTVLCG